LRGRVSRFYIIVDPAYLSEAYELSSGDVLEGRILDLEFEGRKYDVFRGREIHFILYHLIVDYLFITKVDWCELREYGLVKKGFIISVRLEKAIKDGVEIPLYTKRDVEI